MSKYNNSFGRFLFYPWGVWVTAYARRNLFTGIIEAKEDYIYSDTDSLKMINKDNHTDYIEQYNNMIVQKLQMAMIWHGLDVDSISAKTINGEIKTLGVWDYEGTYEHFKTLGAKRYMTFKEGKYQLTVAGLSKSDGINYLINRYDNPFDGFTDEMYIPPEHTGKNIHTYIDDIQQGELKDYNGLVSEYSEFSSIHLAPADYSLSIGEEYANFLLSIQTGEL